MNSDQEEALKYAKGRIQEALILGMISWDSKEMRKHWASKYNLMARLEKANIRVAIFVDEETYTRTLIWGEEAVLYTNLMLLNETDL